MSGEYIVISPIPANLVLRYGNRYAMLWPSRRIVPPQQTQPAAVAARMASTPVPPPQPTISQAVPASTAPESVASSSLRLANMTALYSDKLTDARHEH
jgi:hypothetical protein